MDRCKNGLSMIELLVVLAIFSIFILGGFFAFKGQLFKGRDARRKSDLNKVQKALEDYLNDYQCYPDSLALLSSIDTTDPLNSTYYNYFYSYDSTEDCKSWYKIYAKLENETDTIIDKVGCRGGCGPGINYNYWVSSPNMNEVEQVEGEEWPALPGLPTSTLAPTSTSAPTPTPTKTIADTLYGCFGGVCQAIPEGVSCDTVYVGNPTCILSGEYKCGTQEDPENECVED
jgi:prepilin-type N-terminal cleavage/methylation domain-containing protein